MPGLVQLPCHREQGQSGERCREQHRRQPLLGAARRGIQIPGLRLHLHQMVIVRHQQNGVARGHPEQGDEADHRAQGERTAGQGGRRHAADQRARQGKQHEKHVPRLPESKRQQQHDEHEGRGRVQQQFILGGGLRFGRSAVAQKHTGRQLNFGGDRLARSVGKPYLIGALRRCDDDLPPQARQGHGDTGDRGQRRQCAIPSAQQQRS